VPKRQRNDTVLLRDRQLSWFRSDFSAFHHCASECDPRFTFDPGTDPILPTRLDRESTRRGERCNAPGKRARLRPDDLVPGRTLLESTPGKSTTRAR